MTANSPRIRLLLRQADGVAEAGKRAAAEQLYQQIIDEAPETAEAWRGLAQVTRNAEEREAALARARELDPAYETMVDERTEPVQSLVEPESASEDAQPTTFSTDGHAKQRQLAETIEDQDFSGEKEMIDGHVHELAGPLADDSVAGEALYCANHPGRQTNLRCNRCGKPICSSCANRTPVGYRCPECIREQEDVYFTAGAIDYVLAVLVAMPLSLVGGWLATLIGFWSIFLAAFIGTLIGRVAFRAAGRRRGRWLPQLVAACVVIGGLLPALPFLLTGQIGIRLLFTGIYIFMATGATYYQMR